ncbi:aspartyl protease family protein [Roseiterribacter gracilis]|uniref:Peptidase A2 domain-containing protein n=1 Tax=Roseiterribacter gracilis TaxID=2812848 RepID=A0A8S8XC99_9PROT|nr:hypothetical protein TMPK1_11070 [Rhodospirillales bacterium TMPK1]
MKFRDRLRACALVFAAVLFGAAYATAASPAHVIKLDPYRVRLRTVEASVNGVQGRFLFDTGGGLTALSPSFAAKAGCTPWARTSGMTMTGERVDGPRCDNLRLRVGSFEHQAAIVGILDPAKFLDPSAEPLDGIIALDLFDGRTVTLDLAANLFVVESSSSSAERIKGARELPARLGRELQGLALDVYVAIATAKGPVWFTIDSGNSSTTLVSKHIAAELGVEVTDGLHSGKFDVAPGIHVESDRLFTPDLTLDGNLGMPFLQLWTTTFDLKRGRVWVKRAT